jgi:hypothetical protein
MSKETNEWELDWWWLDVLEGEVGEEEKQEAQWLLEKSALAHQRYESWRSLKKRVQSSDWISRVNWDEAFFDRQKEQVMAQIEKQFPRPRPRP